MDTEKITVLMVEPDKEPYAAEFENELHSLQKAVDGYLETITLSQTAVLVCNEEGRLRRLPKNRRVGNNILVGTFFIAGIADDDFCSLSNEDIKKYTAQFAVPSLS